MKQYLQPKLDISCYLNALCFELSWRLCHLWLR